MSGILDTLARLTDSRKAVIAGLTFMLISVSALGLLIVYLFTVHGSLFKPETASAWLTLAGSLAGIATWLATKLMQTIAQEDASAKGTVTATATVNQKQ